VYYTVQVRLSDTILFVIFVLMAYFWYWYSPWCSWYPNGRRWFITFKTPGE